MNIFGQKTFRYPYSNLKFPGQHSEERILFITREGYLILQLKLIGVCLIAVLGLLLGPILFSKINLLGFTLRFITPFFLILWSFGSLLIAWWIYIVWRKTLFIITNRRLTKFIYTTPWSHYQMSLGLNQIVDTGAYQKGFLQMLSGLGYFVARSSAGAIKNFKIINIAFAEDLHNYVNKLLFAFNEKRGELDNFRPFIPFLKGEARDKFVRQVTPQFAKKKPESVND